MTPPAVLEAPRKSRGRQESPLRATGRDVNVPDAAEEGRGAPAASAVGPAIRSLTLHTERGSVRIPGMRAEYETVRRWAGSSAAPGVRVTILGDSLEIDAVAEVPETHGGPKARLATAVCGRVHALDLGYCGIDGTRLSEPAVGLSCEPDFLVVRWESLESGAVTRTPRPRAERGSLDFTGAADLVGEVLSDSSDDKDTHSEPPLLFAAGVREFWRADCRDGRCSLEIFVRDDADWTPADADADGYLASPVLGRRYRLTAGPPRAGLPQFRVEERDA